MQLAELFYSIQGEGKLMGVPSVFIRASGCNLRCVWCDTPHASWNPEGEDVPLSHILRRIAQYPTSHVVFTGGEPVIMAEAESLCRQLKERGHHITVETAATVFKPLAMDLASISPKLAHSTPWKVVSPAQAERHNQLRLNIPAIQRFIDHAPQMQLKFVVTQAADLTEIEELLRPLKGWTPQDVLLMPEGVEASVLQQRGTWLVEECKRRGYRYCPRLHVELYGHRRGT